jgi:hypothetical protein
MHIKQRLSILKMFTSYPVVFCGASYYNEYNLVKLRMLLTAAGKWRCGRVMKKSTFISILALLIAAAGAVVAFLAYFSKKKCVLCDDFDDFEDDMMAEDPDDAEYYAAEMESVGAEEQEPAEAEEQPEDEQAQEEKPAEPEA